MPIVKMPDGAMVEMPDQITPEMGARLRALTNHTSAVDKAKQINSGAEKTVGGLDAGLSMLTGAIGGTVGRIGGTIGGIAGSIAAGEFGTQKGVQRAAESAQDAQQALTYQPKTEAGKQALEAIGRLFESSKLEGVGPMVPPTTLPVGPVVQAATRRVAGPVQRVIRDAVEAVKPAERQMAGGGSASVFEDTLRRERAASLPVPLNLTKGQATRDFSQLQWERETAKRPEGAPLRAAIDEQNQRILQNMDAWFDQTGAQAGGLRQTGEAVSKAVVEKAGKAKMEVRKAYRQAEEAGAMGEKIDVSPLQKYLKEHEAEAINAGVLTAAGVKLKNLAEGGTVSLKGLEEIRKMVGKLSGKDATNATFGRELKGIIDQMTEGKGGDLYKQARALRFKYAKEFENQGVVNKLLSKKPGTTDRSVAFEDVFDHSILKGSRDDVYALRKTLQNAGPNGQQAWRELQGGTIRHLKDEITKNVQVNERGERIISPARLDRLVTELDKDGKLELIFGKQGAQQIRDVNQIALDAFTTPPGSVNHANTASILVQALDQTAPGGVIGSVTKFGRNILRTREIKKQVQEALSQPGAP